MPSANSDYFEPTDFKLKEDKINARIKLSLTR